MFNSFPKWEDGQIIDIRGVVMVETIQFYDDVDTLEKISEFVNDEIRIDYHNPENPILKLKTKKGTIVANIGDYIVKKNNEFYIRRF